MQISFVHPIPYFVECRHFCHSVWRPRAKLWARSQSVDIHVETLSACSEMHVLEALGACSCSGVILALVGLMVGAYPGSFAVLIVVAGGQPHDAPPAKSTPNRRGGGFRRQRVASQSPATWQPAAAKAAVAGRIVGKSHSRCVADAVYPAAADMRAWLSARNLVVAQPLRVNEL